MHSVKVACTLAFLLLSMAAPLDAQEARSRPSSDSQVNNARTLIDGGSFSEALSILRPLAPEDLEDEEQVGVLFLFGLAALGAGQDPETPESERKEYVDEAIGAFHRILVVRPELVRVRLELARAFYVKGDDRLSRRNFERVLAGNPHPTVAANIRRFLAIIRQRRRWSGYFGATLAPDTNINTSSDEQVIYIDALGAVRQFTLDDPQESRSGLGVALWGGGEYEHPLRSNVRLRAGGSISRTEYEGREFDQMSLSAHLGPRWLLGDRTEISLVGSASRSWSGGEPQSHALGGRLEVARLLSRKLLVRTQVSYHEREYDEATHLNGPRSSISLRGLWQATPTLRFDASAGLNREQTETARERNEGQSLGLGASIDLPRGFTVGVNGELRWTEYEGNWSPFTSPGESRSDRTQSLSFSLYNRGFTVKGFSPKLVVTREMRESNAQLHDYRRTRGELQFVRQL
ncbi:surface lipoprotein assembly modifier [Candidatus Synechococcus spongiarum]|uniref:Surface lipoprotein assembly modifier C-terminal domain-containing protein n=1 Tax=Candidatus Synechococcus spongiarum LMB bulk15N TaxID=1943583 RepID=A0A1T1D5J0_9SYNE|nr:surface lipoprotein assembly modifier [Candidatus Synechococcus spongiarum]OOV36114.1 hypothetical protein BV53_01925 [Candidatus Synechococcus spongiarum LMB bulk15N]